MTSQCLVISDIWVKVHVDIGDLLEILGYDSLGAHRARVLGVQQAVEERNQIKTNLLYFKIRLDKELKYKLDRLLIKIK